MQTLNAIRSGWARRRASTVATELVSFGHWWLSELKDCAKAFRSKLLGDNASYVLIVDDDQASLQPFPIEAGAQPLLLAVTALPQSRDVIAAPGKANPHLRIYLRGHRVLFCAFALPSMDERHVADAIGLQAERRSPIDIHELYLGWRIARTYEDGSREVELAMVRRSDVDLLRRIASTSGWDLKAVIPGEPEAESTGAPNLLPRSSARLAFTMGSTEKKLLACACGLALVWMLTIWGQSVYERWTLDEQVEHAQAQLRQIADQTALLKKQSAPVVALRELMQRPDAASALEAFSASLPHDAWIYDAELQTTPQGIQIHVEGYAKSAPALTSALEDSRRFTSVQLVQASASSQNADEQRFELRAQLSSGVRR